MPVESILTRELDIRFIDARKIAIEAKLSLGIEGYPSQDEETLVVDEAIRIFEQQHEGVRDIMRRLKDDLESIKTPSVCGSQRSSMTYDDKDGSRRTSDYSISTESSIDEEGSSMRGSGRFRRFSNRMRRLSLVR